MSRPIGLKRNPTGSTTSGLTSTSSTLSRSGSSLRAPLHDVTGFGHSNLPTVAPDTLSGTDKRKSLQPSSYIGSTGSLSSINTTSTLDSAAGTIKRSLSARNQEDGVVDSVPSLRKKVAAVSAELASEKEAHAMLRKELTKARTELASRRSAESARITALEAEVDRLCRSKEEAEQLTQHIIAKCGEQIASMEATHKKDIDQAKLEAVEAHTKLYELLSRLEENGIDALSLKPFKHSKGTTISENSQVSTCNDSHANQGGAADRLLQNRVSPLDVVVSGGFVLSSMHRQDIDALKTSLADAKATLQSLEQINKASSLLTLSEGVSSELDGVNQRLEEALTICASEIRTKYDSEDEGMEEVEREVGLDEDDSDPSVDEGMTHPSERHEGYHGDELHENVTYNDGSMKREDGLGEALDETVELMVLNDGDNTPAGDEDGTKGMTMPKDDEGIVMIGLSEEENHAVDNEQDGDEEGEVLRATSSTPRPNNYGTGERKLNTVREESDDDANGNDVKGLLHFDHEGSERTGDMTTGNLSVVSGVGSLDEFLALEEEARTEMFNRQATITLPR